MVMGLLIGTFFGLFLAKSDVLNPDVIIGQLQFRRFTMIRVFVAAIITGLVVYLIFHHLGFERLNWKTFRIVPDVIGGGLLGTGIALAGSCPGTVFGQIGLGYKEALFTLSGIISGGICFYMVSPYFLNSTLSWPSEKWTIDEMLNQNFSTTSIMFILVLLISVWLLKKLPK